LLAAFCWLRQQEITDQLVDLLIAIVQGIGARAERKIERQVLADFRQVTGKTTILFQLAEAAIEHPDGVVRAVLYPVVGEQTLRDLVREYKASGPSYRQQVQTSMRASYGHHYRQMVPHLLRLLEFRSNNAVHRPVIHALTLIRAYSGRTEHHFAADEQVPLDGVVRPGWRDQVVKTDAHACEQVNRIAYEICVLETLREHLRCKEVWVVGAVRYRNPDEDLPADFAQRREAYYAALKLPTDADAFIDGLQTQMHAALARFDASLRHNHDPAVRLTTRHGQGWIALSPLAPQPEPVNLARLKGEVGRRWPMTTVLDYLKETDLRVGFTACFASTASREVLEREVLRKRLLLCLHGLGTNTGLKRASVGTHGETYADLLYVRRRFIQKEHLRAAIAQVANAVFAVRHTAIWGEGTTACASDSKQFGAFDQNLMTQWHARYGGRGVMVYWHVERRSVCIYSQLKTVSSSEVAAMIEGVLRHGTDMTVARQYVDSHGQSEVAFAFCHLLGFQLLPRLKAIGTQKLYRPVAGRPEAYPQLQPILTRPINWDLIRQQYDELVKYATALRLGTAESEAILRRFTRSKLQHPAYRALSELGKALKTIFLCEYLTSEALRREIQEGLNVVESWNAANLFLFYGKSGEVATNRKDEQEVALLALHLLQVSLVYINTLMLQKVLAEPAWRDRLSARDYRALTPLMYHHVNPYGLFPLDMTARLDLDVETEAS